MTATSPAPSPANPLSPAEKAAASAYLERTRDELLAAVDGLTDAQWHFRSAPDRWSIAGVVEHVTIVEGRVGGFLSTMDQAPASEPILNAVEIDRLIVAEIPARSNRVQAPPPLHPSGQSTPAELLARFQETRAGIREALDKQQFLRERSRPHPIFGPWDGYHWILGTGAHCARHISQIREIKAHADFPQGGGE